MSEKIAFESPKYRDRIIRGLYLNEDVREARIEIVHENKVVAKCLVPAYKIWNYHAHWTEIIDDHLERPNNGQEG